MSTYFRLLTGSIDKHLGNQHFYVPLLGVLTALFLEGKWALATQI